MFFTSPPVATFPKKSRNSNSNESEFVIDSTILIGEKCDPVTELDEYLSEVYREKLPEELEPEINTIKITAQPEDTLRQANNLAYQLKEKLKSKEWEQQITSILIAAGSNENNAAWKEFLTEAGIDKNLIKIEINKSLNIQDLSLKTSVYEIDNTIFICKPEPIEVVQEYLNKLYETRLPKTIKPTINTIKITAQAYNDYDEANSLACKLEARLQSKEWKQQITSILIAADSNEENVAWKKLLIEAGIDKNLIKNEMKSAQPLIF